MANASTDQPSVVEGVFPPVLSPEENTAFERAVAALPSPRLLQLHGLLKIMWCAALDYGDQKKGLTRE